LIGLATDEATSQSLLSPISKLIGSPTTVSAILSISFTDFQFQVQILNTSKEGVVISSSEFALISFLW
jgi:hypothetical protein